MIRLYSFAIAFLLLSLMFARHDDTSALLSQVNMEPTCAYPNGKPVEQIKGQARCYGYDPCNACSTCSSCAYCSNGGTCGVCSGSGTSKSYKSNVVSKGSSQNGGSSRGHSRSSRSNDITNNAFENPSGSTFIRTVYLPTDAVVSVATLNVRSGPGTAFKILAQLTEGDMVIILETAGDNWVKVEASVLAGEAEMMVQGYVFKKYLSY